MARDPSTFTPEERKLFDDAVKCASEAAAAVNEQLGKLGPQCYENNEARAACREAKALGDAKWEEWFGCYVFYYYELLENEPCDTPFINPFNKVDDFPDVEEDDQDEEPLPGTDPDGGTGAGDEPGDDEDGCFCPPVCNETPQFMNVIFDWKFINGIPYSGKYENLGVYSAEPAKENHNFSPAGYNKTDPKSKELNGFKDS